METATQTKEQDHAYQNASGWAETIAELVGALGCDFERMEELRNNLESDPSDMLASVWRDELAELEWAALIDGEKFENADDVRERIQEGPLSLEVRSPWYTPGADEDSRKPEEFRILLSTGGPALQIRGELSEHSEPTRAWLEYQDWGTPWSDRPMKGQPLRCACVITLASPFQQRAGVAPIRKE